MKINNLVIPQKLALLLESHTWENLAESHSLENISQSKYHNEYKFLSILEMIGQTEQLKEISKSVEAESYGLKKNTSDEYTIDVDKVIVIISGRYEEELICLYYPNDMSKPILVESYWPQRGSCQWLKISDSFDHFLNLIGYVID